MASGEHSPSDSDQYVLTRNLTASTRLNLQHYLWKDILGFNLHPAIPVRHEHGGDFRIADLGTGTGIWPIDLSRQLQSAHLDGFDVSKDQYPPKECLPPNVSLDTLDVFSPIPEHLVGRYDIVNVRLFLAVVRDDDPTPILENSMRMLKPGGHIQWIEQNHDNLSISAPDPSLKRTATEQVVDRMRHVTKMGWISRLPQTLRQVGFTSITTNTYPIPPALGAFTNHTQLGAYEEVSYVCMDHDTGAAFRKLIQESFEEMRRGVTLTYSPQVVVGRKPL